MPPYLPWLLLAFSSGAVNTGGFLAGGTFVSHVTGFGTMAGIEIQKAEFSNVLLILTVPLYFLLGSMLSTWMVDRRTQRSLEPYYHRPLLISAILIDCVAVGGHIGIFEPFDHTYQPENHYYLLVLLCLASGIENAVVTAATGGILRASHLTGTTTDLGAGLMRASIMKRGSLERQLETRINLLRTSQIAFFVLGSGFAAFCFRFDSFLGFLLPAAVTMLSIALSFFKK
jgi:uncharacterized membrane protein YoaK (UPF0700 family)